MAQPKPIAQQNPTRQRIVLLVPDLKNSVIAELVAGNLNQIAYSPYGQQSAQHEVVTRLGFNGELHEVQLARYFLGNGYRTYNPRLMCFHSPDSWSPFGRGGLNPYMYCKGEPVMYSDPTGHSVWAFSRAIMKLTDQIGAVATPVINKIATTISSGVSQFAQSAKKVIVENLILSDGLKKLGPPPPKFIQRPPSNRVFHQNRYPTLPSKKFDPGQQSRYGASRGQPSRSVRSDISTRPAAINQLDGFRHPSSDTHTELLNMNGNPVALIRRGR